MLLKSRGSTNKSFEMELSHIYRIAYVPSDSAYLKLLVLLTSLLVVCVTAIEKGIHYDHHPLCPMKNRLNLHRDVAEPVHFKIETGKIPVHMIYILLHVQPISILCLPLEMVSTTASILRRSDVNQSIPRDTKYAIDAEHAIYMEVAERSPSSRVLSNI